MDSRPARRFAAPTFRGLRASSGESPTAGHDESADAVEFARFCYHRRRVGWPELYDEMCAVAARGAFRGWGFAELAEHGISFTLSDTPGLAAIVARVCSEERGGAGRAAARRDGEAVRLAEAEAGGDVEVEARRLRAALSLGATAQ